MPTIALTDKAQSDLLSLHETYAVSAGAKAASDIIIHILDRFQQLAVFSDMGRLTLRPGVRELVFNRYPFLAQYRIQGSQIQILRVRHQRAERLQRADPTPLK